MRSLLALCGLPSRRHALLTALAGLLSCTCTFATAASQPSEDAVKAAHLYQFLSYAEWPLAAYENADSPYVVGVIGADDVLAEFERMAAGRRVQGRPLLARKLAPGEPLVGIHLLHLGRDAPATGPLLSALAGRPVLVVTDQPSGLPYFAALNFRTVDQKLRFEASQRAAERAGLKLSSSLLLLAERRAP